MGSTRLPGKVLEPLAGRPSLLRIVERLERARGLDGVAVLTSVADGDDAIAELCEREGVTCLRGSENDVLARYQGAAEALGPEFVVRVTADCPLVDPQVIADLLALRAAARGVVYASVATGAVGAETGLRRFPDGLDAEVFTAAALAQADADAHDPYEREHVTPYIWRHPELFAAATLECERDLGRERWTVDHAADLELVSAVYERLREPFGWREVLEVIEREPALRDLNSAHRVQPS